MEQVKLKYGSRREIADFTRQAKLTGLFQVCSNFEQIKITVFIIFLN